MRVSEDALMLPFFGGSLCSLSAVLSCQDVPEEEEAGGGVKAVPARLLERKEQLCPGAGGSGCVDSGPRSLSAALAQPSSPEP